MVYQPIKYVSPGEVFAAGIVLPVVATTIVAARFYIRVRTYAGQTGTDDWLIALALLTLVAMGVALAYGAGQHVLGYNTPHFDYSSEEAALNDIEPPIELAGKLLYVFSLFMIACYGFTKASVLYFYRRIFPIKKGSTIDILTYLLLGVTVVWSLGFLFQFAFSCGTHFSAEWGSAQEIIDYCHGGQAEEKGLAVSDLILDVIIIAVPIPFVWMLHMPTSRKLAVCGVLLVGLVAIGASIARLTITYLETAEGSNPYRDRDQTLTVVMYWAMLEAGLSVIAACLPSLRFFFTTKTPQTWLASVRSALSLHSIRSSQSGTDSRKASASKQKIKAGRLKSDSSQEQIPGEGNLAPQTTLSTTDDQAQAPKSGAVFVQRTFDQAGDHV